MNPDSSERASAAISVVIATHSLERYQMLARALDSVLASQTSPDEVIVAVDHNSALAERIRQDRDDVIVIEHSGSSGASGARNAGADVARGRVLVFTDDDVTVDVDWLSELTSPFKDPSVLGTGGRTLPAWQGVAPGWFPDEFGWVVGASHAGLPTEQTAVRNVWSENMAIRHEAFARVQGFREGFGKVGNVSRPEDTDLCIRSVDAQPGGRWIYAPAAIVNHVVPDSRATFSFFLRRCYWEGAGKIELSAQLDGYEELGDERDYLMRIVPLAFLREMRHGRLDRAGALMAGVAAAGFGALRALVKARRRG